MNFKSFDWKGKESFAFEDFAKGVERFGDQKFKCYVKIACNNFPNSILHKRPLAKTKEKAFGFIHTDPDS